MDVVRDSNVGRRCVNESVIRPPEPPAKSVVSIDEENRTPQDVGSSVAMASNHGVCQAPPHAVSGTLSLHHVEQGSAAITELKFLYSMVKMHRTGHVGVLSLPLAKSGARQVRGVNVPHTRLSNMALLTPSPSASTLGGMLLDGEATPPYPLTSPEPGARLFRCFSYIYNPIHLARDLALSLTLCPYILTLTPLYPITPSQPQHPQPQPQPHKSPTPSPTPTNAQRPTPTRQPQHPLL